MAAMPWYRKTADEAFQELGTGPAGLHEKTAADKLESHGPNRLPEAKRVSRVVILLRQFASPQIYILLIAAAVTFALAEYKDTIVIGVVLLFNAVIGYIQESRAEESVRALQKMIVPQARVVRESREREISSHIANRITQNGDTQGVQPSAGLLQAPKTDEDHARHTENRG